MIWWILGIIGAFIVGFLTGFDLGWKIVYDRTVVFLKEIESRKD